MRVSEQFSRKTLAVDDVKRALDHAAKIGISAVSFTGGEPLLCFDQVVDLIEHAGRLGIKYIRTGTNAFQLWQARGLNFDVEVRRIAERLAATPLRNLWISLDSAVPEVHEEMRGFPGVVDAIERALPIFHEAGIYPSANLGINRNVGGDATRDVRLDETDGSDERFAESYHTAFRRFYARACDMGFTIVNACYPMSMESLPDADQMGAVYAATSADSVVCFSPREKALLYRTLSGVIPEFRGQLQIFSPRCSLHALAQEHAGQAGSSYPCRGGIDYFFIDSQDGNTYPCGYRGNDNLGKFELFDRASTDRKFECRQCDWECFRDPSELAGPLMQAAADPIGLWGRFRRDREFFRLWWQDLQYYRACNFFDGRRPPRLDRLRRFGTVQTPVSGQAFVGSASNACTEEELSQQDFRILTPN